MCLRDRPRSFAPGPVGQKTLVQISMDSRRTPCSASPSTVSALVAAYTSAVSNVVMPSSRAAATQASAASSLDLRSVGDPVPVGDLADFQAAAAEVTMFHEQQPISRCAGRRGRAGRQTLSPRSTRGFGIRIRRMLMPRIVVYIMMPCVLSPGKRSAASRLTLRPDEQALARRSAPAGRRTMTSAMSLVVLPGSDQQHDQQHDHEHVVLADAPPARRRRRGPGRGPGPGPCAAGPTARPAAAPLTCGSARSGRAAWTAGWRPCGRSGAW